MSETLLQHILSAQQRANLPPRQKSVVWHFTDYENRESIIHHGGLFSYAAAKNQGIKFSPGGNKLSTELDARKKTNGKYLNEYIHLAFSHDIPMLAVILNTGRIEHPLLLAIDLSVINGADVLFSKTVANKSHAEIFSADRAKEEIDFDLLFRENNIDKEMRDRRNEARKAEILVPDFIPLDKIDEIKKTKRAPMAERCVFVPRAKPEDLVEMPSARFIWSHGFAPSQKKNNVYALHAAAENVKKFQSIFPGATKRDFLEVSTKSEEKIGQRLSAFSLKIETPAGAINLESAYQGSKVFENGGPYTDIYEMNAKSAKQDPRVRESGEIVGFDFFGDPWPLNPPTAFYDWLYLSCLRPHQEYLKEHVCKYKGFTDIEFNPRKSQSCQAGACALLVSLLKLNALDTVLQSKKIFLEMSQADALPQNR